MGINKAEKEHLGKVAALGCIVCHHEGRFGVAAEVHHIRQGAAMGWRFMQGRRRGRNYTDMSVIY